MAAAVLALWRYNMKIPTTIQKSPNNEMVLPRIAGRLLFFFVDLGLLAGTGTLVSGFMSADVDVEHLSDTYKPVVASTLPSNKSPKIRLIHTLLMLINEDNNLIF